jgi:DnaJ-class molecular chaperone
MSDFDFRTCPRCNGYGIRDNGHNCTNCGGSGTHGLRSKDGVIGSGEIIIDRKTGRQISHAEFAKRITEKGGAA